MSKSRIQYTIKNRPNVTKYDALINTSYSRRIVDRKGIHTQTCITNDTYHIVLGGMTIIKGTVAYVREYHI
jgi:hypothetical protein